MDEEVRVETRDLLELIGQLTVENRALRARLAAVRQARSVRAAASTGETVDGHAWTSSVPLKRAG